MVKLEEQEKELTAFLSGDIDHHTAKEIREAIDLKAEQCRPEQLILDFKDVTFMDSSGIGLVMGRYKLMKELGGSVTVVHVSAHIRKVMILAGLDKLAVIQK
ncbi:Stage II sporulation protein AA [uncultured Ruminococcus sp.]|uniref:STAS domain-containing protein n=1 Tax=Massiliimalia timonensis TaxID=1987501 RepID=UPI000822DBD6|nr:anti-sigma factor antagonist [Massiliimalia timonensis]SCH87884.1 Stage II sporulation protein AA [uncultured Clostridium sp.]SCI20529.1 Stage II sporulation protein AA [uncultured Ruminococcus sp.]